LETWSSIKDETNPDHFGEQTLHFRQQRKVFPEKREEEETKTDRSSEVLLGRRKKGIDEIPSQNTRAGDVTLSGKKGRSHANA